MDNFKEFKYKQDNQINEKLITFGGKAYPSSGHVVIMSGGGGSGKGFIQDNLLGIEGKVFDVDKLKSLALRINRFKKDISDELGISPEDITQTNPEHVKLIHKYLKDVGIADSSQQAFFSSILTTASDLKPNIIFDVTLKSMTKLSSITSDVKYLGYDPKKIHIVWVLNDVEVALKQNKNPERGRVVADDIIINTHMGTSSTMHQILKDTKALKKYMNGDIIVTFNKAGIDNKLITSLTKSKDKIGLKGTSSGHYLKEADYIYLKHSGKNALKPAQIDDVILKKFIEYVPVDAKAVWKQWLKEIK